MKYHISLLLNRMKYHISLLLNSLIIIIKLLYKKNVHNENSIKQKKSLLIELPTVNLQTTFHILLSIVLKKNFHIIFFHFGGFRINLISIFLRLFLKKKNYKIVDFNENLKIKKTFNKFVSKEKFINHTYKGHKIGKYIYQSYCRLYLKTSLNLNA